MTNIFVWISLGQKEREELVRNVTNSNLIFASELSQESQLEAFLSSEVVFGNIPSQWLNKASRLQWLQLESTGFNEYLNIPKNTMSQLKITNLKELFKVPVSETVIGGILSIYRGIDQLTLLKEKMEWQGSSMRPTLNTLNKKKVMIAGSGAIGQRAKELLLGFNCEVTILSKSPGKGDISSVDEFDDSLSEMDIIISCLPATKETIHFFNKDRIGKFKKSSVFVNVGRGSAIDESALIEALESEKLLGCVLDVTEKEPLPENDPLWNSPRTILTQHTGGGSEFELLDKVKIFVENLKRYHAEIPLQYTINFEKGY